MKNSVINTMLNGASKAESKRQSHDLTVSLIDLNMIEHNDANFYGLRDIEELSSSIHLLGLMNPITVERISDNKYRIISGHRRLTAYQHNYEKYGEKYSKVPAFVTNEKNSLLKQLALLDANATARELTDIEKIQQAGQYATLLKELKETEGLPGAIKDLVAERLNVSSAHAQRLINIDKNLTEEGKQYLEEGKLTVSSADRIATLGEEGQKEVFQYIDESEPTTRDELNAFISDLKNNDEKYTFISQEQLEKTLYFQHISAINQLVVGAHTTTSKHEIKEIMLGIAKMAKQAIREIEKI